MPGVYFPVVEIAEQLLSVLFFVGKGFGVELGLVIIHPLGEAVYEGVFGGECLFIGRGLHLFEEVV